MALPSGRHHNRFWHIVGSPWFAAIAFGVAAYFGVSLVNDFTDTIPLWLRLVTGVITAILVRWGIALDWHRLIRHRQ